MSGEGIIQAAAPPPRPPETDRDARPPQPAPAGEPGTAEATGPVATFTLSHALLRSLTANPDLIALRGQVNVNQAMVEVANTYPWNPFVQAQFFPRGQPFVANMPGAPASGTGYPNYYVWAMQRFELAHQTRHRTDSALAALDQAQWNGFQGELLTVAQTTRLYFTALYQKGLYDLAREAADLNRHLAGVVARRFEANLARASDVTTARVTARQSRRQAELAGAAYQAALLALRQQLNLPVDAPINLTDGLATFEWLPLSPEGRSPDARLAAELIEGRPDVMAARAGVSVSEANLRLAHAARVPDLSAGPIYETASDTSKYLGLRVQMEVPVWNTGKPLERQREAELHRQQLAADQLKVRATLEAQAAIDQYERVRALVAKEKPVRADAAAPELKEINRLFEAGQADILAVLATQTNLLQERRVYLDLLNQLAQSAAAVIQTTGLPPQRVLRLDVGVFTPGQHPGPTRTGQPETLRKSP